MHLRAPSAAVLAAVLLLGFSFWETAAQSKAGRAADQPLPRTDANSKLAHQQMVENLNKGRIDIYFAGDSITRRWRATDYPQFLANWNENFFGWNAANFGWGGDSTQNMLWRLRNGELEGIQPKVIVLLAGTNNVGNAPASDAKVADITKGIKALLDTLQEKAPRAAIILMGILPRNDGARPTAVMPSINKINENVAKFADGKTIRYLNINDKLADKDGKLFEGMTVDRLHLSLKGYQVWADALKPLFTALLGPPSKEDHAPPPTGDPSAVKKKVLAKSPAPRGLTDGTLALRSTCEYQSSLVPTRAREDRLLQLETAESREKTSVWSSVACPPWIPLRSVRSYTESRENGRHHGEEGTVWQLGHTHPGSSKAGYLTIITVQGARLLT